MAHRLCASVLGVSVSAHFLSANATVVECDPIVPILISSPQRISFHSADYHTRYIEIVTLRMINF